MKESPVGRRRGEGLMVKNKKEREKRRKEKKRRERKKERKKENNKKNLEYNNHDQALITVPLERPEEPTFLSLSHLHIP